MTQAVDDIEKDQELLKMLNKGLEALSIQLSSQQLDQLMGYISLIVQWNKTYNLTAIREPKEIIIQHLFDALAAHLLVTESVQAIVEVSGQQPLCLDIGSGVGIPGIPLAILYEDLEWVLVDSNGKKARFLREVKRVLGLKNIRVEACRVDQLQLHGPFLVTARALSTCQQILEWVEPFITKQSQVLLFKSHQGIEEMSSFKSDHYSHRIVPLEVPMLQAERVMLVFDRII